jgi:hypothetical protein
VLHYTRLAVRQTGVQFAEQESYKWYVKIFIFLRGDHVIGNFDNLQNKSFFVRSLLQK